MSIRLKIVSLCSIVLLSAPGLSIAQQAAFPTPLNIRPASANQALTFPLCPQNSSGALASNAEQTQGKRVKNSPPQTFPNVNTCIVSPIDNFNYGRTTVGTDPATDKVRTTITYVPIVLKVHFPGNIILDPSTSSLACVRKGPNTYAPGETVSVAQRVFNSPLFTPTRIISNGVDVSFGPGSGTQLIEGFMRANVWSQVENTGYSVNLSTDTNNPVVVDIYAPSDSVVKSTVIKCDDTHVTVKSGVIKFKNFKNLIDQALNDKRGTYMLPILISYNLDIDAGHGQIISGYHSNSDFAYVVASVYDSGLHSGVDDINVVAAEIADWMMDPGGYNGAPTYKVSGKCLVHTSVGFNFRLPEAALQAGSDNFTYHFPDFPFIDWFYRTTPQGTGNKDPKTSPKYSFMGGLTHDAGTVCHQ